MFHTHDTHVGWQGALDRYLKKGNMLHNGPVSKALIAEVAQVVAVAPHLLPKLWVAHWWADHVLVHRMRMLLQLPGEVTQMVVHLHGTLTHRRSSTDGRSTWHAMVLHEDVHGKSSACPQDFSPESGRLRNVADIIQSNVKEEA